MGERYIDGTVIYKDLSKVLVQMRGETSHTGNLRVLDSILNKVSNLIAQLRSNALFPDPKTNLSSSAFPHLHNFGFPVLWILVPLSSLNRGTQEAHYF